MNRSKINRRNGNALKISEQLPRPQPPGPAGLCGAAPHPGTDGAPPKLRLLPRRRLLPPRLLVMLLFSFFISVFIIFFFGLGRLPGGSCGGCGAGPGAGARSWAQRRAPSGPAAHSPAPHPHPAPLPPPPRSLADPRSPPASSLLVPFAPFVLRRLALAARASGGFCKTGRIKTSDIILFDRGIRNDKVPSPEGGENGEFLKNKRAASRLCLPALLAVA